jgi:hypothetical protein
VGWWDDIARVIGAARQADDRDGRADGVDAGAAGGGNAITGGEGGHRIFGE